ncbi:hypothetical protein BGZ98_006267 [Dissophora globulifera]|nr:hypothetical protein BGZ98_006267 [Dissophora globulifera]
MGSVPRSSAVLQRPSISTVIPHHGSLLQIPKPVMPQRSYSADHLWAEDLEITAMTPSGSDATNRHVMSLQRALSKLAESTENKEEGDEDDIEDDGPITMRNSRLSPSSSPATGVSQMKDVRKAAEVSDNDVMPAPASLTHGAGGSDMTLATLSDPFDKDSQQQQQSSKYKMKDRMAWFFQRQDSVQAHDLPRMLAPPSSSAPETDVYRQPSKSGVLSNLLKLQEFGRSRKSRSSQQKYKKDVKIKKSAPYLRSANTSTAALHKRSIFASNQPLPSAAPLPGTAPSLSNFQPNLRSPHRRSGQFGEFVQALSTMNSPFHSPLASPRGSISGDVTPGGSIHFALGSVYGGGGGGDGSIVDNASLSHEEQMRITIAVADILERQDYVLRLAKALIKYGAPSHRLEDAIDYSARSLELNLQCIYLPNFMMVAFTDYETHTSETHLLKVSAGLDMYKCALVHQVQKMVTHSSMPIEEAIMKLDAINAKKDVNPRWLTVFAYGVASFAAASMFFKGSWIDAGVSFLMGIGVGLLVWLAEKVPSYSNICEITMSVVVAFIAEALNHHNVCQSAVKMAGIVILLPGYSVTCSILELSSRQIISGSVRLFYAVVFSLLLGYGLTIGTSLWMLIDPSSRSDETPNTCPASQMDPKWNVLFVPIFAISLNIWLKAHPRQWPLATVLSIVGYVVSYVLSTYADAKTELSSALAAFAIGLLGNIYQRLTRQLTFQAVVCAVFFLVPGSMGLKGALSLFTENITDGANFAMQMVITAIAISVGLFASALVVYPMGNRRQVAAIAISQPVEPKYYAAIAHGSDAAHRKDESVLAESSWREVADLHGDADAMRERTYHLGAYPSNDQSVPLSRHRVQQHRADILYQIQLEQAEEEEEAYRQRVLEEQRVRMQAQIEDARRRIA